MLGLQENKLESDAKAVKQELVPSQQTTSKYMLMEDADNSQTLASYDFTIEARRNVRPRRQDNPVHTNSQINSMNT